MKEVKQKIGQPNNSMFIRSCIIYGIILAIMLVVAPLIFKAIMAPMAVDGMNGAWYGIFIPITLVIMAIGLFRSWRRRWSLAYFDWYRQESKKCNYETCPRCGSPMELRHRTRSSSVKVGEKVTTTTYSDGSQTVNSENVYGTVSQTNSYHECTNSKCKMEPEQHISQSHLPWKTKQIRCLVLNDDTALNNKNTCAKDLLLSRLIAPIIAIVIAVLGLFSIYSYAGSMSGEWSHTTADKEASRTINEYENYLLSLDTEYAHWSFYYEKKPTDMKNYLGELFLKKDNGIGYGIEYYEKDDKNVLVYNFEGDSAGTNLADGEYVLTKIDGINVLIDDENEKIYKEGTEFYDTYAPKLLALTHDAVISMLFDKVDGGEHAMSGSNDFWMEFARKDNTMIYSYMLSDDVSKISGDEFRAITTYPDELMKEQWFFSYGNSDYIYEVDVEDFVYA